GGGQIVREPYPDRQQRQCDDDTGDRAAAAIASLGFAHRLQRLTAKMRDLRPRFYHADLPVQPPPRRAWRVLPHALHHGGDVADPAAGGPDKRPTTLPFGAQLGVRDRLRIREGEREQGRRADKRPGSADNNELSRRPRAHHFSPLL